MPSRRDVWRQTVRDITGAFNCSEIKELTKELETFITERRALEAKELIADEATETSHSTNERERGISSNDATSGAIP